jgi:hypothetical protein
MRQRARLELTSPHDSANSRLKKATAMAVTPEEKN